MKPKDEGIAFKVIAASFLFKKKIRINLPKLEFH